MNDRYTDAYKYSPNNKSLVKGSTLLRTTN